jgi:hypothetical protein
VASRDQALIALLPAPLQDRVDRAGVPVFLPRAIGLDRAHLVAARTYAALSVPLPGLTVSLHTARIAHRHPGITAAGRTVAMRGTSGFTTVNERIRTATWIEAGAAHALDLECADPTDARCADDALLLELVESLARAGGGAAR